MTFQVLLTMEPQLTKLRLLNHIQFASWHAQRTCERSWHHPCHGSTLNRPSPFLKVRTVAATTKTSTTATAQQKWLPPPKHPCLAGLRLFGRGSKLRTASNPSKTCPSFPGAKKHLKHGIGRKGAVGIAVKLMCDWCDLFKLHSFANRVAPKRPAKGLMGAPHPAIGESGWQHHAYGSSGEQGWNGPGALGSLWARDFSQQFLSMSQATNMTGHCQSELTHGGNLLGLSGDLKEMFGWRRSLEEQKPSIVFWVGNILLRPQQHNI